MAQQASGIYARSFGRSEGKTACLRLWVRSRQGTSRPVMDGRDGMVAEEDRVDLIPANTIPTVTARRIRVILNASKLHHPGDILFTSLAEQQGDRAIGVVLSGGGSDGALAIQSIKQSGGTTFAQHPGSARFPRMPISAIETGCVGLVLRPNEDRPRADPGEWPRCASRRPCV